jgi:hypothetical protein
VWLWKGVPRALRSGIGVAGVRAGVEGPEDAGEEGWTTHILKHC